MRFFRKKSDGYKKETKQFLEHLHCECSVFLKNSRISEIQEAYRKAVKLGKLEGFTPLFIVPSALLLEEIFNHREVEKVNLSQIQDGRTILAKLWNESTEELEEDIIFQTNMEAIPDETINNVLTWEVKDERLVEEVILAKIPTKHPWEIFSSLPFGGWNECPEPKEMMAVSKYWYEMFGAVPAVMSSDSLEFYLEHPICQREEANLLAKEHFAFCEDRVFQCTASGTLMELANCILGSAVWWFWWD